MFSYAWDLAEAGVVSVADALRARHINTITLACSYHAGKFLRPHGINGKVYFPEDGTAYFKTRQDRYGELKPVENSLLAETDVLEECCQLANMDVNAWMVLMHNSRLGQKHPDACVANAFGDRYIYSLCPSSPAAREYAVALCADIAERYPIQSLSLETPGFLNFEHGYHHEFALVEQNAWLNNLLGLCFCERCKEGAKSAGIDADGLKYRVKTAIETYLASDVDHAGDMAEAFWVAEIVVDPDMGSFLRWRCGVVESLISEIRAAIRRDVTLAIIPSLARPTSGAWYEGSDLKKIAQIADHLEICLYEPNPERMRSDLFDVIHRIGGTKGLRCILRPGFPDMSNGESVMAALTALRASGIDDVSFYNYGHLRKANLDWIGEALAALELAE